MTADTALAKPIKSKPDDSQIQVELPVGTHVLEVVVEDSAGTPSDPVTIVVIVDPDPRSEPRIIDFAPKRLHIGKRSDPFTIKGEHLYVPQSDPPQKYQVEFLQADKDEIDAKINAVAIKPNSTATSLQVVVEVDEDAQPGERRLRVTTPNGVGKSTSFCKIEKPA